MKAVGIVNQAFRTRYPNEPNFVEAVRAAYDDVMRRHYNGTLELYRNERRYRVLGVNSVNLVELSRLLNSYVGNHQEVFTSWKEDFEKLYHAVEGFDTKHVRPAEDHISLDQVVAAVISSTFGLPVPYLGYLYSRSAFGDIHSSREGTPFVYAHSHFVLDNKITGPSLVNVLRNPSVTEIYRSTFRLYTGGDWNRVMHATTTPDDRTLVAGHTLWCVKEEQSFYVERPKMAPALVIPRFYTLFDYNDRLKYDKESAKGKLCHTTTELRVR